MQIVCTFFIFSSFSIQQFVKKTEEINGLFIFIFNYRKIMLYIN